MPDPQPIGEDAEYSRFDSNGLEQCPTCGTYLSPPHHMGRVVQPTGPTSSTRYEHLSETDPADGPFYCGECWDSHCTEQAERTHWTLSEFSSEEQIYYGE
jgi:hypothetical protein